MPVIALIRHGQTDWNKEQRVQGVSDIPLNATGIAQAEALAERFLTEIREEWHALHSSPLGRAVETATPLSRELGLEIRPLPEFRERNYGKGEGLVWTEIHRLYGDTVPGRETPAEVRERTLPALLRLIEQSPMDNQIIMSHGGTIRTVLQTLTRGMYPPSGDPIPNTGVNMVHVDGDQLWVPDFEPISAAELLRQVREESNV